MNRAGAYDAVIIGAGHNGLVAACYLGLAGKRVLVLEKNAGLGGATRSMEVFPGTGARISVYSYLVSLLPQKILTDLGIRFETRRRAVASYTPVVEDGKTRGLLISNASEAVTRESFAAFTGSEHEYARYRILEEKLTLFAQKVWPTLLAPLPSKEALRAQFTTPAEREIWDYLVERPLSALIEDHLSDDIVRGAVFTDAKIGVLTHPDDPTLLQNRTFLYHIIGQGTGEWRVPVGGMGALVDALVERAAGLGVEFHTSAEVVRVDAASPEKVVSFRQGESEQTVGARYVLFNTASNIANRLLQGAREKDGAPVKDGAREATHAYEEEQVPGSVFKINLLLDHLPALKDERVDARDAFSGTFHLNEGYEQMKTSYRSAQRGIRGDGLPGEMYCHSLTDPSILPPALQAQGYHTLTLFGLDVPYAWFGAAMNGADNEQVKAEITRDYLASINCFTAEDIHACLARDANGSPCIEAKSPLDLEHSLGLPRGNIFHGNLSWPFAEREEDAGTWGVETRYANVYLCGSSAKRGGAVSGIPGHNAAMKVLGETG